MTNGFCDIRDITAAVAEATRASGITDGIVVASVPGSTASVTTIEYEAGALQDLKQAIERMAPEEIDYAHNERWGDGNGFSHVRAAMMGPSVALPVTNGKPVLGTWQQIVLVDFDNRPRHRKVIIQVVGL
jgi:secondary thiamine-phosphate synthase enzyme